MEIRARRARVALVLVCLALIALASIAFTGIAAGQPYNQPSPPTVLPTTLERPTTGPDVEGRQAAQPEVEGQLPFTGGQVVLATLVGSSLIVAGVTLTRATRRRRSS